MLSLASPLRPYISDPSRNQLIIMYHDSKLAIEIGPDPRTTAGQFWSDLLKRNQNGRLITVKNANKGKLMLIVRIKQFDDDMESEVSCLQYYTVLECVSHLSL